MQEKPYLFLDFDRTLFDTELFYNWLGEDVDTRITALLIGTTTPPDWKTMLYPETIEFLQTAKKDFHLVVLTFSTVQKLQEMKLRDSGVLALVDDVIITDGDKGAAAKSYIDKKGIRLRANVFVDDKEGMLREMHTRNPEVRLFLIERNRVERTLGEAVSLGQRISSLKELLTFL
jgi:FMN phosphatase YigB (HAD superfamily)